MSLLTRRITGVRSPAQEGSSARRRHPAPTAPDSLGPTARAYSSPSSPLPGFHCPDRWTSGKTIAGSERVVNRIDGLRLQGPQGGADRPTRAGGRGAMFGAGPERRRRRPRRGRGWQPPAPGQRRCGPRSRRISGNPPLSSPPSGSGLGPPFSDPEGPVPAFAVSVAEPEAVGEPRPGRWDPRG